MEGSGHVDNGQWRPGGSQLRPGDSWTPKNRPLVADSHHFDEDEDQDENPDPY